MSRTVRAGIVLVAGMLVATACGGDDDGVGEATAAGADKHLAVVASFYPLAEVATKIGGAAVEVTNLTTAGAEPHDLELTSRQVEQLEDADLVIVMGRDFQPAVEKVAARRDGGVVSVLDVLPLGEGKVEEEHEGEEEQGMAEGGRAARPTVRAAAVDESGEEEHGEEGLDPHVWLDPVYMQDIADEVAKALVKVSPSKTETFEANAAKLIADLQDLDERYQVRLERCERKTIVTAHEAFARLANRYGLQQEGIAGVSPEAEPNPDRLAELADLVQRQGLTTIFTESLVSPKVAETLAREAGVQTAVLNPLEGLTEDELEAGKDYFDVMNENLETLREALGCS